MADIDALIANLPGTIQENILNQTRVQSAQQNMLANAFKMQQQINAQNALRGIYANQNNIDQATGLPRPGAMGPLITSAPALGLDFMDTSMKFREAQSREMINNMRTNEYYTGIFDRGVVSPLVQYANSLPPDLPADQRNQMIATKKDELTKSTVQEYGVPESVADRWGNLQYNGNWGVQSQMFQQHQREINKGWHKGVDFGTNPPTEYWWNEAYGPQHMFKSDFRTPYTSTGIARPPGMPHAGKMMYVENPDKSVTPQMVLQQGNTFTDQEGKAVKVVGEVPSSSPDYAGPQAKPSGDTKLTGDAYLAKLPNDRQQMVKALAEGRMAVPTWALRDPTWKQIIADTAQYDPSFDTTNFNRRNKAYQEFTSGQDGRNVRSINTALNHAAELWHSADNLAAHEWYRGEKGPIVNWVNQTVMQNIDPGLKGALNRFKVNADALGSELERATRGDRTAEQGVQEWRSSFSNADTPEAIRESIKEAWKLLAGRVDSMQEGFKKAVGPRSDVTNLFTPFAQETYRAFGEGRAPPDISGLVSAATGNRSQAQGPAVSSHDTLDAAKNAIPRGDTRWYPIQMPQGGRQWWRRTPSGSLEPGGSGDQPVPGGQ